MITKSVQRIFFSFLFSAVIFFTASAQVENTIFNTLNIAYFGKSVTRPGIKAGTNLFIYNFKPHVRASGDSSLRQLILSANVGAYYHFHNHYGLFLNSEIGFRIKYPKGFYWQFDVGAGYLRTFLDTTEKHVEPPVLITFQYAPMWLLLFPFLLQVFSYLSNVPLFPVAL